MMKNKKEDLESTIKEKVSPLLEETMTRSWGITIPKFESDISDQLKKPALHLYIPHNLPFKEAKKQFKKEFLKRELQTHLGNISELGKVLGLDRRSIHRAIRELDIDMQTLRKKINLEDQQLEAFVDQTIRHTLDQYKEIIHPQKMEEFYQEVPILSRNIARFLPQDPMTWDEAETEFEKQFFDHALENHDWNISRTARELGLRAETLYRKIRELGLKGE